MQAVKAVKQNYKPTPEILALLEEFRRMVNECIQIGLARNITSMKSLSQKAYHQLEKHPIPTYYRLTAISKATGILRNYKQTLKKHPMAKKPYASKLMLTDCYAFKVEEGKLRLPLKAREYAFIPLNSHVLRSIQGYTVRSVCLTACTLSIAFSKETAQIEPTELIGIDRNLDNITVAFSNSETKRFDLSKATEIKAKYREVKSHFKRNDVRIRKRIFGKYGRKQRNRVNQMLHCVSKRIVERAKAERLGIVMENIKGIQKLYRKGNGQGTQYRSKLNGWSFYELQRQIEYKAKWEGILVILVSAHKTSSVCAVCGSEIAECTERKVYCPRCLRAMDRDVNAALNIRQRGMRFVPNGFACEAVRGNPELVILRADANKLTHHSKS